MNEWAEFVRRRVPDMAGRTDKECVDLLWEITCFPLGSMEKIEYQLKQYAEEKGE